MSDAGDARTRFILRELPGFLRRVAVATNLETALLVARTYAGRRLYIPRPDKMSAQHPLAQLVGLDQARSLADRLGGECYDNIPAATQAHRDLAILELMDRGAGTAQIARATGLSRSTVRRHLARLRPLAAAPAKAPRLSPKPGRTGARAAHGA